MSTQALSPELTEARDMLLMKLMGKYVGTTTVTVATTYNLRGRAKVRPGLSYKEFKPLFFPASGRYFIAPVAFALILFAVVPKAGQFWYGLLILGVLMLVAALISDERKGHRIHIDDKGIGIEGTFYPWVDLSETAILTGFNDTNPKNPHMQEYLVIVFAKGGRKEFSIEKYHAFWGITSELSRYIEYFKTPASAG
jgi:hypothetical protein